jgi:hypothetical protein
MTDEEIIKKAGAKWSRTRGTMDSYLKLIIQYAREDEREACAKVCDELADTAGEELYYRAYIDAAAKLRARGEK